MATLQKPPPEWLCLPQFFVGVGKDFEGPFVLEGYEVSPETDELFMCPNFQKEVAKGCHPRFRSSIRTPESCEKLSETTTGFAAVRRLKISTVVPGNKNIREDGTKALCKNGLCMHGMSKEHHTSLHQVHNVPLSTVYAFCLIYL